MTLPIPPNTEVVRLLRACPLLESFPPGDAERLATHTTLKQLAPGELVFARGATGKEFYIVAEGAIHLTIPTISTHTSRGDGTDATEAIVRIVRQGEFFGEIACLDQDGLRTANARVTETCILLTVQRDEFLALVQAHPPAAMGLIRHLAARVRYHTDSLAGLVRPEDFVTAEERNRNLWQVVADTGATWSAHWVFTVLNVVLWVIWLGFNGNQLIKDLPTINGLTMCVSLQAIIMTIFVLVAQKRADEKENHRKELQFQWAQATMERLNYVSARLDSIERHGCTIPTQTPTIHAS